MLMELLGLCVRQALALLYAVSWMKFLSTASVARELVEEWHVTA
jgi:hypothetical protein